MSLLSILRAAADAFFENPVNVVATSVALVVLGLVLWHYTLPALWQQYWPFG